MELRARTSAKPRPNCQFHCRADPGMIPVQTNVLRNRPLDKLAHPSSEACFVLQNTAFRAPAISPKCISCETSLKNCKLKMWKRSVRARLPTKRESWGCQNKAFVRDVLKIWKWKMWKRSFRARLPSKSQSGRRENEAFVRYVHQDLKVEDVKTKLRARLPSKPWSWGCENEAFVRDFPQKVKGAIWSWNSCATKLSCETSLLAVRSLGCEIFVIAVNRFFQDL